VTQVFGLVSRWIFGSDSRLFGHAVAARALDYKTYFDTIPYAHEEAALVDRANLFQRVRLVIAPLLFRAAVRRASLPLSPQWGDFLMPRILLSSSELQMLPLGLFRAFLRVQHSTMAS
jgi:ABC-type glycerol-3-phosphate transport system permease component